MESGFNRYKSQFVTNISHELRTPLTVVRGEIEAMLDGVHPADPDNLELLLDEVNVMERLLEDLLGRIRDVRTGPDGYIYLLTDHDDGELVRLEPV